jgi:hypothetical protein
MAVNLTVTRHDEQELVVSVGDVEIFHYVYRPSTPPFEGPKPYLHPVRTLAGDIVTAYRPHDHRWHKGIQMTASEVSGQNFWGGVTYVHGKGYVDLPNVGTMRHKNFTFTEQGPERIRFEEELTWHTQAGEHWGDETREFTVRDADGDAWTLEFATTLTNVRPEPLILGSPTTQGREMAGYTGLFWRGPRAFTDGEILAANGLGGPEMMGQPAHWLAYIGHHDEVDRSSTLLFLDHPTNKSTHWFVRNTPFAAVNPSFAFFDTVELAPSDTLHQHYRITIANGAWTRDQLESYVEEHPW